MKPTLFSSKVTLGLATFVFFVLAIGIISQPPVNAAPSSVLPVLASKEISPTNGAPSKASFACAGSEVWATSTCHGFATNTDLAACRMAANASCNTTCAQVAADLSNDPDATKACEDECQARGEDCHGSFHADVTACRLVALNPGYACFSEGTIRMTCTCNN